MLCLACDWRFEVTRGVVVGITRLFPPSPKLSCASRPPTGSQAPGALISSSVSRGLVRRGGTTGSTEKIRSIEPMPCSTTCPPKARSSFSLLTPPAELRVKDHHGSRSMAAQSSRIAAQALASMPLCGDGMEAICRRYGDRGGQHGVPCAGFQWQNSRLSSNFVSNSGARCTAMLPGRDREALRIGRCSFESFLTRP